MKNTDMFKTSDRVSFLIICLGFSSTMSLWYFPVLSGDVFALFHRYFY